MQRPSWAAKRAGGRAFTLRFGPSVGPPRGRTGVEGWVATHAMCSHPVADAEVFSKDLASRRARPSRPWATSTRQACRMGRNTGCLSLQPTRRTSTPCARPRFRPAAAVTPLSTSTNSRRPVTSWSAKCSSIRSLARFSCVDAGTTSAPSGRPVTSTATTRLAPFVRP